MLSDRCLVCLSVNDVGVLWTNDWIGLYQDETLRGGRPGPGNIVLDGDSALLP